jgi:hypothetical protein
LLSIDTTEPVQMILRVRVPAWSASSATVKINGVQSDVTAAANSYLAIARVWKKGDRVEISLPMALHSKSMADDHSLRAILYGPLVLAGRLGTDGLTNELRFGPEGPELQKASALQIPQFAAAGKHLDEWIKPGDRPMAFQTSGQKTNVVLEPFFRLANERYSLYWNVV